MAFDMTRAPAVSGGSNRDQLDRHARFAVLTGSGAGGAMAGAAIALAIGRLDPLLAQACLALIFAAAALVACLTLIESFDRGQTLAAVLIGLHIAALVAAPIVLQSAPGLSAHVACAALATLLAFVAFADLSGGAVGRLGVHSGLFAFAAVYAAIYGVMG